MRLKVTNTPGCTPENDRYLECLKYVKMEK